MVTVALGAGVIGAGPSASQSGAHEVVHGRVGWDGAVSGASGWTAQRISTGEYRLQFHGDDVQLDLDRWDAVADATVVPMGAGADTVRFTSDTGLVDTSFSFTAIVGH